MKTVARRPAFQYHEPMEVQLTSDQQAKLTRMATEQGRAAETLVQEAVERFLNYDEWFGAKSIRAWRRQTGANLSNTTISAK